MFDQIIRNRRILETARYAPLRKELKLIKVKKTPCFSTSKKKIRQIKSRKNSSNHKIRKKLSNHKDEKKCQITKTKKSRQITRFNLNESKLFRIFRILRLKRFLAFSGTCDTLIKKKDIYLFPIT